MQIAPYVRKANFYETDQMGVIHHSNYIRYFEEARVDFMDKLGFGYERASNAGLDFAVLGVFCEYKSMVRFGETISVRAAITSLSPTRLTVGYRIADAESGALRVTGETRHCYFSRIKQRPVSLARELPELYALFESAAGRPDTAD